MKRVMGLGLTPVMLSNNNNNRFPENSLLHLPNYNFCLEALTETLFTILIFKYPSKHPFSLTFFWLILPPLDAINFIKSVMIHPEPYLTVLIDLIAWPGKHKIYCSRGRHLMLDRGSERWFLKSALLKYTYTKNVPISCAQFSGFWQLCSIV